VTKSLHGPVPDGIEILVISELAKVRPAVSVQGDSADELLLAIVCHAAVSREAFAGRSDVTTAAGSAARLDLPAAWIDVAPPPAHIRGGDDWRVLRSDPLFRDL
jgi:hypothetical protein